MSSDQFPIRSATKGPPEEDRVLQEVARHLGKLRFGSVEIMVHDGHVVSLEKRERTRLAPKPRNDATP